ncbi:MAG: FimB/Mfa2 family fimbrial subunit [Bacteroides sp.]|nr:FimB/Mfa2 family fimbrial subunit [Bacteroides sp.]
MHTGIYRNIYIGLICALFLPILFSCVTDSWTDIPIGPAGSQESMVTIVIQSSGTGGSATRAITEANETDVQQIDVLVFETTADGGKYDSTVMSDEIETHQSDSRLKTFTIKLKQGDWDLVILANARDILSGITPDGLTKSQVLAQLEASQSAGHKWPTDPFAPFPMWGDVGEVAISDDTYLTGNDRVRLVRMVSRVDVRIVDDAATNFRLTSVDVYNYNTAGTLVPATADWDATAYKASAPNVPLSATTVQGPLVYDGTAIANNACVREIYLFEVENHSDSDHEVHKGLLQRSCLVIGGIWDANGDGDFTNDGAPTYYRIDYVHTGNDVKSYLDVVRNHHYGFRVTKISGYGYDDSETAFKSAPVNIESEVVPWNEADMTDLYDDGQYFFSTSANPLQLQGMAGVATLKVMTDCPDWKYVLSANFDPDATVTAPGWITVTSGHVPDTEYTTSAADITFALERNTTGVAREAYMHFRAGRFVITVTIRQNPWYIGRVAITPDDITAPSGGTQYTVTIEGFYDDLTPIPIRVRTADGTEIDLGAVSGTTVGDLTTGSGTLDLPSYWLSAAGSRQLVFEYENPIDGQWIQILAPQQVAYWIDISTSDPDLGDFTGWGSYMDITVKGNFPSLPIRFSNTAGTTAVNGSVLPDLPATDNDQAGKTYRVYVPYNDDGNPSYRQIIFHYWDGTYNQSSQQVWTPVFNITQRQGNIVLPEYDWLEYNGNPFDGTLTGWSLGKSPARNRVLAHQDYDHLMGGFALIDNWYEAMGLELPPGMVSDNKANTPYPDGTTSTLLGGMGTTPAYGIGTADDQYLVSNYTPKVTTGCGAYYERDYNKVTDWMLPTALEANQIKYMHASIQRPAGFADVNQPGAEYSAIYVSTELSEYYFFDDIGLSSGMIGSLYPNVWSDIYPRYTYRPSGFPQYTVDLHKTTTMVVLVNNGPTAGLNTNGYFMYWYRKNGSFQTTEVQYVNTRCVRQWNPATDVGGPGYTPTFSW